MKINSIRDAVFAGRTLTTMQGAYEFNTTKLPTRIGEIERKYGVILDRKEVKGKDSRYYEYKLNRNKYRKQVKNYLKSIKN